jgi:hypothetical protein
MTVWEYGYIYVVHTVGPSPAVCIAIDGQASRVLKDSHGLMRAANVVGAAGWIVSGHGEKVPCPAWADDLVRPIEGAVKGDSAMCYFMRRLRESADEPD